MDSFGMLDRVGKKSYEIKAPEILQTPTMGARVPFKLQFTSQLTVTDEKNNFWIFLSGKNWRNQMSQNMMELNNFWKFILRDYPDLRSWNWQIFR